MQSIVNTTCYYLLFFSLCTHSFTSSLCPGLICCIVIVSMHAILTEIPSNCWRNQQLVLFVLNSCFFLSSQSEIKEKCPQLVSIMAVAHIENSGGCAYIYYLLALLIFCVTLNRWYTYCSSTSFQEHVHFSFCVLRMKRNLFSSILNTNLETPQAFPTINWKLLITSFFSGTSGACSFSLFVKL